MINGEEECFIRDKINEIIKNSGNDPIRFDGRDKDFSYDELIESCLGNSLFSFGSLVLVEEPDFLIRKVDDRKLEPVYNYVDNPVYETDLIFYTYQNNFNNRLKAFKKINENAQLITLNSYDYRNFNSYVRTRLNEEGLKLNNEAVTLLSNICKRSATLLNSNLEVLTREIVMELIAYITVDKYIKDAPREIHIYYKFLDETLKDKRSLYKAENQT